MAVPRPLVLALLGTVLLAVTFMALRNSTSASERASAPAPTPSAQQQPAPTAAPAKPTVLDPETAMRAVLSPGTPVTSARFAMRITAAERGGRRERSFVAASGSFVRTQPGKSDFDVRAASLEDGKREAARLLSVGGSAYVLRAGDAYKLPDRTAKTESALRKALGGSAAAKASGVDPAAWLRRPKTAAGGEVGGEKTTRLTADLSGRAIAKDMKRLFKAAGQGAPIPVALPKGFGRKFERAFAKARIDAYVGTSDKVVRKLRITATGTQPKELLEKGESARWTTTLSLSLQRVNQAKKIEAPEKVAKAGLSGRQTRTAQGLYAAAAVGLSPSGGPAQLAGGIVRLAVANRAARVPNRVNRAIDAKRRVVLFFRQEGADDRVTAEGVAALRGRTKALVASDSVNNLAAYGSVVQSVGVTRAPSIVIVGSDGRARLIEGYIDPDALAQEVADTR